MVNVVLSRWRLEVRYTAVVIETIVMSRLDLAPEAFRSRKRMEGGEAYDAGQGERQVTRQIQYCRRRERAGV